MTLQAIGLTLGGGLCISTLAVLAFGVAVMLHNTIIATRCTRRHPNTIWRSRREIERERKKSGVDVAAAGVGAGANGVGGLARRASDAAVSPPAGDGRHVQDRGNPFVGWIPWTLRLSYDRMLNGIPGTGTRDGGMGGKLLDVNLDAVVLFRYHALCLRVTAVTCLLCIGIILPLNMTACSDDIPNCNANLTNYGRTTIANVNYNLTDPVNPATAASVFSHTNAQSFLSNIFWTDYGHTQLLRLYAISLCTWYITYFALKSIKKEWVQNLVLRRVYYLEADHYGKRKAELSHLSSNAPGKEDKNGDIEPWIPHPEHRDTVPNVELYSVLVGGLPSISNEVANSKDMETAMGLTRKAGIDWQLTVATSFFDHCVPNQPGFSSSVVAVTILPGAPELAKAWRKWYAAAAALRRLRFIRQVIKDRQYYNIDEVNDEGDDDDGDVELQGGVAVINGIDADDDSVGFEIDDAFGIHQVDDFLGGSPAHGEIQHNNATFESNGNDKPTVRNEDIDVFTSLNYGPEQQAVYSREMAQGAAACCPNGCCEGRVRRHPIDRLLEMEDETICRLEKAQYELQCAQMQAAMSSADGNETAPDSPDEDDIVASATPGKGSRDRLGIAPQSRYGTPEPQVRDDSPGPCSPASPFVARATSPFNKNDTFLTMNSEGMFRVRKTATFDVEEGVSSSESHTVRRRNNTSTSEDTLLSSGKQQSDQWDQVNRILRLENVANDRASGEDCESNSNNEQHIETGAWKHPLTSFASAIKTECCSGLRAVGKLVKGKAADPLAKKIAKDTTYAAVTFSSRQAAVAARHCLADGRGRQRWLSLHTVPVPPLADAAPCDIITCRGCCRPVTLNLNSNQLMIRRYAALASLLLIYVFYTIPITAAQLLVAPETLPGLFEWMGRTSWLSAEILSGLISALLYTCFFALCPVLFRTIANSGSQATSVQEAEKYALQYYWYFMLVTAFVFTGLADAALNIWNQSDIEQSIEDLLENVAAQTPLTTAATWLNWIIVRTTMTLPLQYLLQVNTFIFKYIGWKCCARCTIGGGPGGPIPYRIYVDGGVVYLCVVALAPQSPIVAPLALLYFLFCVPLWRRNCIFLYRPKFDSGGERWPFLSDVLISSLFMAQFLLTLQMVLRNAFGPALFSAAPAVPTYLYRNFLKKRFGRAYEDAGLLQTSLLDGWDNTAPTSVGKREEFRKFLVDAHKAAYIPVCIAGGATKILTSEPAVVIPSDNDDMLGVSDFAGPVPSPVNSEGGLVSQDGYEGWVNSNQSRQHGSCMRRALSPKKIVSSGSSVIEIETQPKQRCV